MNLPYKSWIVTHCLQKRKDIRGFASKIYNIVQSDEDPTQIKYQFH